MVNIINYIGGIISAYLLAILLAQVADIWLEKLYDDNMAILSYPAQKKERSSIHYYFLPVGFMFVFARVLWPITVLDFLLYILVSFFLLLIICSDIEQEIIFNEMIVGLIICSVIDFFCRQPVFADRIIAALCGGGLFLLLAVLLKGAIGGGDIKLIFALGLLLGTERLILVIVIGILLGAIAALVLLASKQKKRSDYFAYGPYFALPALIFYIVL